jgi:hypothetical protein
MSASVKTQILDYVKGMFETYPTLDAPDTFEFIPTLVTRAPIGAQPTGRRYAVGIYGGQESKSFRTYPKTQVIMEMIIEGYLMKDKNVDLLQQLEQCQEEIERRLMMDETFGGLAINCNVTNTSSEVDGRFDTYGEVAVICEITFQHYRTDPRSSV